MTKIINCKLTGEVAYGYQEYLQTKHWNRKKYALSRRTPRKCLYCSSRTNLEVHHLTYIRIGNERMEDLCFLCDDCHEKAHSNPVILKEIEKRKEIQNIIDKERIKYGKDKYLARHNLSTEEELFRKYEAAQKFLSLQGRKLQQPKKKRKGLIYGIYLNGQLVSSIKGKAQAIAQLKKFGLSGKQAKSVIEKNKKINGLEAKICNL